MDIAPDLRGRIELAGDQSGGITAFALAIIVGVGPPAYPGVPGHAPDLGKARRDAGTIDRAMDALRKLVPDAGSYVSQSNFFERDRQRSFWSANYPRLQAVKAKYDPDGLFFVHHRVGSEDLERPRIHSVDQTLSGAARQWREGGPKRLVRVSRARFPDHVRQLEGVTMAYRS
jgi:hypothetical protein